jgi:hypothetical protein
MEFRKYIVHTYITDGGSVQWYVPGRLIEAIVKPPQDLQSSSVYLTAAELGLKERSLREMHAWQREWRIYDGKEDPRAAVHSPGYERAAERIKELSAIIDGAVKRYYAQL